MTTNGVCSCFLASVALSSSVWSLCADRGVIKEVESDGMLMPPSARNAWRHKINEVVVSVCTLYYSRKIIFHGRA